MFHKSTVSAAGFSCQPFFRTLPGCSNLLQNKERLLHLHNCRSFPEVRNGCKFTPALVPSVPKPSGEVGNTQNRLKEQELQQQLYLNLTKKNNKVQKKVVKKTSINLNFSLCSRLSLLLQKSAINLHPHKLGCRT